MEKLQQVPSGSTENSAKSSPVLPNKTKLDKPYLSFYKILTNDWNCSEMVFLETTINKNLIEMFKNIQNFDKTQNIFKFQNLSFHQIRFPLMR